MRKTWKTNSLIWNLIMRIWLTRDRRNSMCFFSRTSFSSIIRVSEAENIELTCYYNFWTSFMSKYSLFNVDKIFFAHSLNFETSCVDICDKVDQDVFIVVINNNNYNNININDEICYYKIFENADQATLNTKLTIKSHERRNSCEWFALMLTILNTKQFIW